MSGQIAVWLLLLVSVCKFANASYCNLKSCDGQRHTICLFKPNEQGPKCKKVLGVGLEPGEKEKLLNLHNQLRNKVASGKETRGRPGPQPAATNMKALEWDDELANIAQTWANQCTWEHDKCRDVARYPVGQNLAISGTTGDISTITVKEMAKGWYEEVKYFDKRQVSRFTHLHASNGKQVGHYTQFVWAKTTKLGCGKIKFIKDGYKNVFLVCNYGPSGNYKYQPIYKTTPKRSLFNFI